MKASLKVRDEQNHRNPLLRAKIPITVCGFPFISGVAAGDTQDLSLNLRTNSSNGPSLKLSYNPNTATTNPFSLSLKSGVGVFGSPCNSPLIMSAHFSLFGNPNPTFSLQIKPQFGDFSLKKTAVSASLPNPIPNPNSDPPKENGGGVHFNGDGAGYVPERPLDRRDLTTEFDNHVDGLFTGVAVTAKTMLPVMNRAVVKFRWGVNFPSDFGGKKKLPFLTVDKIGIERVESDAATETVKPKEKNTGEIEMLKGMCLWMRREMEVLQRENTEMKQSLEGMMRSSGVSLRHRQRESVDVRKKPLSPSVENSGDLESWRSKKRNDGEEKGGRREIKKSENTVESDIGEELKKAIKAASSSSSSS